jgi:hypothetical protein
VSGTLGVLARVGFFVLVVVVGVFFFREDTRRELTNRWAMRKCPEVIEADIRLLMPWSAPKVIECTGTPANATCSVETTEHGGRKTAPVKEWDCSKRHISEDFYREFMKAAMSAPVPAPAQAPEPRHTEKMQKVQDDFVASIRYVSQKLRDRYTELGESGTWPAGLDFPMR